MTSAIKQYYIISDGDSSYTMTLDGCIEFIRAESDQFNDATPDDELPEYTISPIWMTEEEFDNLPES